MGEYASKGLANGLGIPALVLGGAAFAQNNGLLGGLFGNNNGGAMWADNAKLRAERYADKVGIETYAQTRRENTDLRDRIMGEWLKPLSQEAAANRERIAVLETKVDGNFVLQQKDMALLRKDVEISTLKSDAKIDQVAGMAKCGLDRMSDAVRGLSETIDAWKCGKIAAGAICPPVMPRWNAFVTPENNAPDVQPVTGNINAR